MTLQMTPRQLNFHNNDGRYGFLYGDSGIYHAYLGGGNSGRRLCARH